MSNSQPDPRSGYVGIRERPSRKCPTMELHAELVRTNPDYVARRLLAERSMVAYRRAARGPPPVITIPVVVHVVYNTKEQNISKAQIDGQIAVLNKDFMAMNRDKASVPRPFKSRIGNPNLKFALAVRDPFGRKTDGVTKTQTRIESFEVTIPGKMKFGSEGGIDAWPSDRYLNIWVCNLEQGTLGYATFPGVSPEIDGVVIGYKYFGTKGEAESPYDGGRTTTHEIGHWLNLLHIWGEVGCDFDDNVADTPIQYRENTGKPKFPTLSCDNGPHGDMFMNYMDYTDDDIMCMFTIGQCERMRATIDSPRASIKNSDGLRPASSRTAAVRIAPTVRRTRGPAPNRVFNGVEWVSGEIA